MQRVCGLGPCPGCLYEPSRRYKPAYNFASCHLPEGDELCLEWQGIFHDLGDHRVCDAAECDRKAHLLTTVVPPGVAACREADRLYAVVSLKTGSPVVHGTHDTLQTAKPHRTRIGRQPNDRQAAKRNTFVICEAGHLH